MKQVVRWIYIVVAVAMTIFSLTRLYDGASYLFSVLSHGGPWNRWAILSTGEILFAAAGMAGLWICVGKRDYRWAAVFIALQFVFPTLIETLRWDYMSM